MKVFSKLRKSIPQSMPGALPSIFTGKLRVGVHPTTLNDAAEAALRDFHASSKRVADYLPILGGLRYSLVAEGVLDSLSSEDIRGLLILGDSDEIRTAFSNDDVKLSFEAAVSYLRDRWTWKEYEVLGMNFYDSKLSWTLSSYGMRNWFTKSLHLEAIFNPEGLVDNFVKHHNKAVGKSMYSIDNYYGSAPVCYLSYLLPEIHKNHDLMVSLLRAESSISLYVDEIRDNPEYAFPVISADIEASPDYFLPVLTGKESLDSLDDSSSQIVDIAVQHELGMDSNVPMKMKMGVLHALLMERSSQERVS